MSADTIREYYAYTEWANRRLFETTARLSQDQLFSSDLEHVWPIAATLVHIMWGQAIWLERWLGGTPRFDFELEDYPDLAAIRSHWDEIDQKTNAFVSALTDQRLRDSLTYQIRSGKTPSFSLEQTMLHQANHATYHRGEVAALLTRLDASPGELDFTRYLVARSIPS